MRCRDCDTLLPILELRETFLQVPDGELSQWRIDPDTGIELSVGIDRQRVAVHAIDDTGHEIDQMYLVGGVTGARVPRLVPVVAYDDRLKDFPDMTDPVQVDHLSLGSDRVRALRDQVSRACLHQN